MPHIEPSACRVNLPRTRASLYGTFEGALPVVVAYSQAMEPLTPAEIVGLSPPDADQLPLTAAQSAELESRLASFAQDRQNGVTWTALKAELAQRCP